MKIKYSQKEMNKIIFTILKMCKSENKSFQVPPFPTPCPLLRVGKPPRTKWLLSQSFVVISSFHLLVETGWLPFDKQLSAIESPSLSWAPKLLCWSCLCLCSTLQITASLTPSSLSWLQAERDSWAIFSRVLAVGTVFLFLSAHLLPLQGFNKY